MISSPRGARSRAPRRRCSAHASAGGRRCGQASGRLTTLSDGVVGPARYPTRRLDDSDGVRAQVFVLEEADCRQVRPCRRAAALRSRRSAPAQSGPPRERSSRWWCGSGKGLPLTRKCTQQVSLRFLSRGAEDGGAAGGVTRKSRGGRSGIGRHGTGDERGDVTYWAAQVKEAVRSDVAFLKERGRRSPAAPRSLVVAPLGPLAQHSRRTACRAPPSRAPPLARRRVRPGTPA